MIDRRLPVGLYSSRGDIEIEGTREAIRALVRSFRATPSTLTFVVPWQRGPKPYDGFLKEFQVHTGEGMVILRRQDDVLIASGAPHCLDLMAKNIATLLGDNEATHTHLEYYPGHPYIDGGSLPLVVGIVP
jgi:hypothetical protein